MPYDTAAMVDSRQVFRFATSGSQRAGQAWRMASRQPSWITRITVLAFLLVIGIPVGLLILGAILAAALIFGVLVLVNGLMMKIRGLLPKRDGRKNVRVIRRIDGQ